MTPLEAMNAPKLFGPRFEGESWNPGAWPRRRSRL
jgi:hypothetical protein